MVDTIADSFPCSKMFGVYKWEMYIKTYLIVQGYKVQVMSQVSFTAVVKVKLV